MVTVKYPVDFYQNPIFRAAAIASEIVFLFFSYSSLVIYSFVAKMFLVLNRMSSL